jgi:hypothetical protein
MCFDIYFKIIPAARWIRQRFAGDYAQTVTGSDFLTREWNSADAPELIMTAQYQVQACG